MISVHHGDCRDLLPNIGLVADAVVTDPPYDLVAMTRRFGNGQAPSRSPDHQRFARGFMGQQWDGEGVAFDPKTWRTVAAALRPGGFLVAFGGARTHHRLACAIEDAGFVIQDCLMWLFATGFPKRRDMLKPAYEPIVLAYKPGGKRTLQVDECRIGTSRGAPASLSRDKNLNGNAPFSRMVGIDTDLDPNLGRWPANVCHDGSDEVVACFPYVGGTTAVRELRRNPKPDRSDGYGMDKGNAPPSGQSYGDGGGSAARFFFSAKAGIQDRWGSRHPTVKPIELMKWLVALVTPPGGTVLDPFAGSGPTAVAALAAGRNAILIEREDSYIADIRERLAFYQGGGQHSMQAKNRHRKVDHGPLFAGPPLTPAEDAADSLASYNAAVQAVGEQVKAGAPVPEFMRSRRVRP